MIVGIICYVVRMLHDMAKKQVTVKCYGPIALSRENSSPWEDVFINYKTRPGKSHHHFLTLWSYDNLLREWFYLELKRFKNNEIELSEDLIKCRSAKQALNSLNIYIDIDNNIYTKKKCIDRTEADQMISAFMAKLGFLNVHMRWKRPKFVVIPG